MAHPAKEIKKALGRLEAVWDKTEWAVVARPIGSGTIYDVIQTATKAVVISLTSQADADAMAQQLNSAMATLRRSEQQAAFDAIAPEMVRWGQLLNG